MLLVRGDNREREEGEEGEEQTDDAGQKLSCFLFDSSLFGLETGVDSVSLA